MLGFVLVLIGVILFCYLIRYGAEKNNVPGTASVVGTACIIAIALIFFGCVFIYMESFEDGRDKGIIASQGQPLTELPLGKEYQVLDKLDLGGTIYLVISSNEGNGPFWYKTDQVNASQVETWDKFSMIKTWDGVRMKSYHPS